MRNNRSVFGRSNHTKLDSKSLSGVSIITCTNRPSRMKNVFLSYLRQDYNPKELIIVLNNNDMNQKEWQARAIDLPDITVLSLDERISLGECYNYAIRHASFDYIAKFDDDDYYAPRYLTKQMAAFNYTYADIIGKTCRFIYFQSVSILGLYEASPQFTYVDYVVGATMIFKKDILDHIKFRNINRGEDSEFQKDCLRQDRKIFSVDKYNYVTIRHHSFEPHTYVFSDCEYLNSCQTTWKTRDYISPISR